MLLILPIVIGGLVLSQLKTQGPYYRHELADPAYAYLFNALKIVKGHSPTHIDHPGTTIQSLSAGLLIARSGFSTVDEVLKRPEAALYYLNIVFLLCFLAAYFWAGKCLYKSTGSLHVALFFQASIFCFPEPFFALRRPTPEILLLVFSLLPIVVLESQARRFSKYCFPVFLALGLVTKVTFLPWIFMIFAVIKKNEIKQFVGLFLVSLFLALLPILGRLRELAAWFFALGTHVGQYGSGEPGLASMGSLRSNILQFATERPLFLICWLALGCALCVLKNIELKRRSILIWAFVGITVQAAVTLKHYGSHYLLAAMILVSLALSYLFHRFHVTRNKRLLWGAWAFVAIGIYFSANAVLKDNRLTRERFNEYLQFEDQGRELGCQVIPYEYASSQIVALYFGSSFSDHLFGDRLQELYPGQVIYDRVSQNFLAFNKVMNDQVRGLVEKNCLLILGSTFLPSDPSFSKLRLSLIADGSFYSLNRLISGP
jgi:hypothetical protein